jgi:hypothetical protein
VSVLKGRFFREGQATVRAVWSHERGVVANDQAPRAQRTLRLLVSAAHEPLARFVGIIDQLSANARPGFLNEGFDVIYHERIVRRLLGICQGERALDW